MPQHQQANYKGKSQDKSLNQKSMDHYSVCYPICLYGLWVVTNIQRLISDFSKMNLGFESPWKKNDGISAGLEANEKLDFVKNEILCRGFHAMILNFMSQKLWSKLGL